MSDAKRKRTSTGSPLEEEEEEEEQQQQQHSNSNSNNNNNNSNDNDNNDANNGDCAVVAATSDECSTAYHALRRVLYTVLSDIEDRSLMLGV